MQRGLGQKLFEHGLRRGEGQRARREGVRSEGSDRVRKVEAERLREVEEDGSGEQAHVLGRSLHRASGAWRRGRWRPRL